MWSSRTWRRAATYKILITLVPVLIAFDPGASEAQTYPEPTPIAAMTQEQFARALALANQHEEADWTGVLQDYLAPFMGASAHLGMYVATGAPDQPGWGADGGGASLRGSRLRTFDTAGFLTPGETTTVRDTSGSGGIFGTFDATSLFGLPSNNSLLFTGSFDYQGDSASLGGVSPTGVAFNVASLRTDTYTFQGSVFYRSGTTYLRGEADYNFARSDETNSRVGSAGSFNSNGYSVDAKLGNVFVLFNTTGASTPTTLPTKAPPKPTGGTLVGLDLSGHIGYFGDRADGFTDNTGFIFGTDQIRSGDIGGRAELFALELPANGLLWKPYAAGTVDQLFGFSSAFTIPSQVAQPGITDVFSVQPARTFGGAEAGVDARGPGGWSVGIKGFYEASSEINIAGGSVYVKIPFNYTAAVAARY
jgi:hypothetical protein